MKNMKKKSAASLLLAFAIVVTSSVALATSAPAAPDAPNAPSVPNAPDAPAAPKAPRIQAVAGTENQTETTSQVTEGDPFLTSRSWEEVYAKYAPFGLGYDAERGRLTYEGKLVRYFEDMYPVGEQTEAGTVCAFASGEVDVYAVRDLTGPILRNADGSFDPSGELLGLRAATQAEFDALTRERENTVREPSGIAQSSVAEDVQTTVESGVVFSKGKTDVVWWTADEYRAWMENEREVLLELAQEEAWAYTGSEGWFQWTPEKVEETMALYESILRQIEDGALVSKTVDGSEDTMLMQSVPTDEVETYETETYEENDEWTGMIAPYEAVGLRWWTDRDGSLRMAVGSCEARGIWDAERGMWITWSMGHSRFDENAKEFIAVYDGDRLTGLRQADESEAAFWDKQRGIE